MEKIMQNGIKNLIIIMEEYAYKMIGLIESGKLVKIMKKE